MPGVARRARDAHSNPLFATRATTKANRSDAEGQATANGEPDELTMHAEAIFSGEKNVSRRAHSGQKSKRTAALPAFPRGCTTQKGCAPTSMSARHLTLKRLTEGCGAPEAKPRRELPRYQRKVEGPSTAPRRTTGPPLLFEDPSRAVKRTSSYLEAGAPVPRPVRNDAPDARLCGRGWHERWPPPVRAKAHPVQTSLRDAFARCQAAADSPSLLKKSKVASSASRS